MKSIDLPFLSNGLEKSPSEWQVYKLGELCEFTQGIQISSINTYRVKEKGFIRYLYINDFSSDNKLRFVKDNFSTKIIFENDLIMANTGCPGVVFRGKYGVLSNNAFKISISKKLNRDYLFNYLSSDDYWFRIRKTFNTAVQPHIGHVNIANLTLLVPPLPEQKKIAEIISKIDLSIKKQEEKLKRLKEIPQSMFSDLLSKTKLRYMQLQEIANLERGKFSHRPRNDPYFFNGEYPYLQITQIPKDRLFVKTHKETLNENGLSVSRLFKKGTLVISIIAQIGEVGILNYDACFPDNLVAIKPKKLSGSNSVYLLFVLRGMRDKIQNLAPQTAQKSINLEILKVLEIPFPELTYQRQISEFLLKHEILIEKLESKIKKIRSLKSALSQVLLSGKKRVRV